MQKNFSLVWPKVPNKKQLKEKNVSTVTATTLIKEIIRRSSEIRGQIIVIKLPSSIIVNEELLTNFAENVQLIATSGAKVYIVHDHTDLVGETLKLFGMDEKLINNIKVADHKSSQIIEMVLSGYINKFIVSKLCSLGCYALGLSGKDGNLIQAKKSKLTRRQTMDQREIIDMGFVSEPIMINPEILLNFEEGDIIPVISPIASDPQGRTHLLDVNLTASIISSSLDADHLILPCDEPTIGVQGSIIKDTRVLQNFLHNKSHPLSAINLIESAVGAIENSTSCVHFVDAKLPDSILLSLFTPKN